MDLQRGFEDYLSSSGFIKEQILFEKAVIDRIQRECMKEEKEQEFIACKKRFTRVRKSYRYFVQNYFDLQQQKVRDLMAKKCVGIKEDTAFITCLDEIGNSTGKILQDSQNLVKALRREMMKEMLQQ